MKRLIYLCMLLSALTSCKKDDDLPVPQKEELPKKCAGCSKVDRAKLITDTINRK
ncbi:hypothetical protein [Sphingobacterium siyangense]|uniref:Lipoprotein n=1 Tax=Sphingobacterium siyangense TaxID=459529 RepID=A0A562MQG8_9SPHI|nr:hypothetical protein [Sphingobacterium siyangense]TWI22164.1 hypothetical protein IQ31_01569 [Sphingobacterium siyangense]